MFVRELVRKIRSQIIETVLIDNIHISLSDLEPQGHTVAI